VAYPEIPEEIRTQVYFREALAASDFQREDWQAAARSMRDAYDFLLDQQRRYKTRFHKGWELHNGGIALLRVGQVIEGVDRILMAYAEDALSAEVGLEDTIDGSPAGLTLRAAGVPEGYLGAIKEAAKRRKLAGKIPHDPNELIREARAQFAVYSQVEARIAEEARQEEAAEKRTIESLTQPPERCCFVGGNYYAGGPNLEPIRHIVSDEGFEPIMPLDFEIAETDVHHRSLLLLHLCRKAIFEVTSPAGQLMELERCRDYDIEPLLVRNVLRDQDPHVSQMISSMAGVKVEPYTTPEELRPLIHDYLCS
jgi:hypothetical protein